MKLGVGVGVIGGVHHEKGRGSVVNWGGVDKKQTDKCRALGQKLMIKVG